MVQKNLINKCKKYGYCIDCHYNHKPDLKVLKLDSECNVYDGKYIFQKGKTPYVLIPIYEIHRESEKAFLIGCNAFTSPLCEETKRRADNNISQDEKWFPKSQLYLSEDQNNIIIPAWLAQKNDVAPELMGYVNK